MIAIAWLAGAALPMAWGWLPPAVAAIVAALVARGRLSAAVPLGGWRLAIAARGPVLRAGLVLATGFVAVVLACALAGAVAQIVIAFPGATFALAAVALAAHALDRLGRLATWSLPVVVVGLAVVGARFEADGPDARGVTVSGPILGIHPFQATSVIIDGYGPFDLPINDFVEPLGGRGYDPPAYAEALERALHRIAEVHFADGPARAYAAFADAKVEFLRTPPVNERRDRTYVTEDQPRVRVSSGTTGQRSRVEFVCPGRRDDPRGARPEAVMSRACPTKYASEASAGLGLTGRWPGYVEMPGNERVGLSKVLGITRQDGIVGAQWRSRERWLVATLVLVVVGAALLRRRGASADATLAAAGLLAFPMLALVAVAACSHSDFGALAARASAPSWASPFASVTTWQGVLVWPAVAAMTTWSVPELGARSAARRAWALLVAGLLMWLGVTALDGASWSSPAWWNADAPIESAIAALADAVASPLGLPILELEAITAAAVGAPMIVGAIMVLRAVGVAAGCSTGRGDGSARWAVVAAVLLAIALGVSRKTTGGVALIPAATGVALVLGSALRRIAARGAWPRAHVPLTSTVLHLLWSALGLALVAHSLPPGGGEPLRWIYAAIAALAAVLLLAACFADPDPPSAAVRGDVTP